MVQTYWHQFWNGIWGQAQLINIDIFQKGYDGKTGTSAVLAAIEDGKRICGFVDHSMHLHGLVVQVERLFFLIAILVFSLNVQTI